MTKPHKWLCRMVMQVVLLLLYARSTAQVKGVVLDSATGKPVVNASMVIKNSAGLAVAFSMSGTDGKFAIAFSDTGKQALLLEANCIGYKKSSRFLKAFDTYFEFILAPSIVELKEITVASGPVVRNHGDTLSYDVASFSRKEDRSIGDVIKHMPGMSVSEDGQIMYNGKAISNLYIQGDDLMDGRYGLATRSITKEMIKSVDVLQNYQPVKVLRNKVFSNSTAVNLVLKDENSLKVAGQAMAGLGLPAQYDVATNLMLFNKSYKMLNSLKANNSGVDYRGDFKQFNAQSFLNIIDETRPNLVLSAETAGSPDLPKENYFFNRSAAANLNNLYNTRDSMQLRLNVQVFTDRNTLTNSNLTEYYLPADTVRYHQQLNTTHLPFQLNTAYTMQVNRFRYYLTNRFSFNYAKENNTGEVLLNGKGFEQHLSARTYDLTNDFNWIPVLKSNDVLSVRWYLSYFRVPQQLRVGEGVDSAALNNNQPYAAAIQDVTTPSLFSHISLGLMKGDRELIRQRYEAGMINEWQQMRSQLNLQQNNGALTAYTGDAGNYLNWRRTKWYLRGSYYIDKKKWQASLSVPLYMQSIYYSQEIYGLRMPKNNVFFNPEAFFRWYASAESYLLARYTANNGFGTIDNVFKGAVLANFLYLRSNSGELQETRTHSAELNYNFQRSVIMLFLSAGLHYNRIATNAIPSIILTDNIQRTVLLPYDNEQSNLGANIGASKYVFALKTKFSIGGSLSRGYFNQFINGIKLPFVNDVLGLNAGIDGKFHDITVGYTGRGNWGMSQLRNTQNGTGLRSQFTRMNQEMSLGYSAPEGWFAGASARHVYATQLGIGNINYLFTDLKIRKKLTRMRADLELNIVNLFDVNEYKLFNFSSNLMSFNAYQIRGRTATARIVWNL